MGQKKIEICRQTKRSQRNVTFRKRKAGLIKKAGELSILTGARVFLYIEDEAEREGKMHVYSSHDPRETMARYAENSSKPHELLTQASYRLCEDKEHNAKWRKTERQLAKEQKEREESRESDESDHGDASD